MGIAVVDAVVAEGVAESPEFIHNIGHISRDSTGRDRQDLRWSAAQPCRSLSINLLSYFQQPPGIFFGGEAGRQQADPTWVPRININCIKKIQFLLIKRKRNTDLFCEKRM